ncbi:MAG: FkbM family methyltransferase, partial [Verrucomicrobiia bacterium]
EVVFGRRAFMASSLASLDGSPSDETRVPIMDSRELLQSFPPPYDVIKVDIEGAEIEFLEHYGEVIAGARALLIEWHSWNSARVEGEGITKLLGEIGFPRRRTMQPAMQVTHEGRAAWCGVELFLRG